MLSASISTASYVCVCVCVCVILLCMCVCKYKFILECVCVCVSTQYTTLKRDTHSKEEGKTYFYLLTRTCSGRKTLQI